MSDSGWWKSVRVLSVLVVFFLFGALPGRSLAEVSTWAVKAPLPVATARAASGVVNGRIYVLGGNLSDGSNTAAVHAYDTSTDTWQPLPPLCTALAASASVTLGSDIFIAGGNPGSLSPAIYKYDTVSGSCAAIGNLVIPRFRMNAAELDGKMYVVGGMGATGVLDSIEEIDLATGVSTIKATLPEARTLAGVSAANGRLYIYGGSNNGTSSSLTWEYDPVSNQFTGKSPMPIAGEVRSSAPVETKIYVAGNMTQGQPGAGVQQYDLPTDSWALLTSVPTVRFAAVSEIVNGTLYVIGGFNSQVSALPVHEAYTLDSSPWPPVPTDTTAPFSGIRTPLSGAVIGGTSFLVTGYAFDNESGIRLVDVSIDGGPWQRAADISDDASWGTWQYNWSPLPADGSHTISVFATNKAGMAGDAGQIVTFSVSHTGGITTMSTNRYGHTATLLGNGKLLVTGGYGNGSATLSSAELFDPATSSWSSAGSMTVPRTLHTATLLPDGKVLIAGGREGNNSLASAEIYDPATNGWSRVADMPNTHSLHTATLLPNNKVLICGESWFAELYDPATGSWSPAGSMASYRYNHTATLLPGGKVLVAGGFAVSAAELYDPATNSWSPAGVMSKSRVSHSATLLPNGKVLVAGGYDQTGGRDASAELYDPATGNWSQAGSMAGTHYMHTATLLKGGTVLVVGGYDSYDTLELYTPSSNSWSYAGSLFEGRAQHTATLLSTGDLLVVGGYGNGVLATVELVKSSDMPADIAPVDLSPVWAVKAPLPVATARSASGAVNGKIYLIGGSLSDAPVSDAVHAYDTVTDSWQTLAPFCTPLSSVGVTFGTDIFLAGGHTGANWPEAIGSAIYKYDTLNGTCAAIGNLVVPRFRMNAAELNGKMYVVGGMGAAGVLDSIEEIDLATGVSAIKATLPQPGTLSGVSAANGRLYIFGGSKDGIYSDVTWEYDPATNQFATKSPMPVASEVNRSVQANGKIYLLGETDFGQTSTGVLQYEPLIDSWTTLTSLPTVRFGASAEVVDGALYVIGGFGQQSPALKVNEAFIFNPLSWTVNSSGPAVPAPYAIDWLVSQHPQVDPDSYLKINGTYYSVVGAPYSWNGPLAAAANLAQCDQTTGQRLILPTGEPLWADTSGMAGMPIVLNGSWPFAVADTAAPVTTITSPGNGAVLTDAYVGSAGIASDGQGSSIYSVEYSIDNGPWSMAAGSTSWSYGFWLGDGAHSLRSRACDRSGNCESAFDLSRNLVNFTVDSHAPSVSIVSPASGSVIAGSVVNIVAAADDGAGTGVASVTISTDAGVTWHPAAPGPGSWSYQWTVPGDGNFQLQAKACDQVGFCASSTATVQRDTTAPSVQVSFDGTKGDHGWYITPVTAAVAASDATAGVASLQCWLNGEAAPCGTVSITSERDNELRVLATDAAGLTTDRLFHVPIDRTIPQMLPLIERASVSTSGAGANGSSVKSRISADGRFVAFTSQASNLVADDTNAVEDVFVRDRYTGSTERVSVSSAGEQATYPLNVPHYTNSQVVSISAAGRYVLFGSDASNLATPYGGTAYKVFLRDRVTDTTELISVSQAGEAGASDSYGGTISADGRFVAFSSSSGNLVPGLSYGYRVYVKDRQTGAVENISVSSAGADGIGNNMLVSGKISSDGRYVVFLSSANNLVPDDTNGSQDLFVHDRQTKETKRVNVSSAGEQSTSSTIANFDMSADGRYIAFESTAKNLVAGVSLSNYSNVYVHDMQTGTTVFADVTQSGAVNGYYSWTNSLSSISPDGRYVAFIPDSFPDFPGTFYPSVVHDMQAGSNELLCPSDCNDASLSNDAGAVAFRSTQILVPGDTNATSDIFVRELSAAGLAGTRGDDGWFVSDVTVTESAAASDNASGVARREYSTDGGSTWMPFASGVILSSEGRLVLTARAVDNAGLISLPAFSAVDIDKSAPVSLLLANNGSSIGEWYTRDVTVSFTATDLVSGVGVTEYKLGEGAWTAYSGAFAVSAQGRTDIYYRSKDRAGNVEVTKSASINIDKIPPTVTIAAPAAGATNSATPQLIYSIGDGTAVVQIDGAVVDKASGASIGPLSDGPHTVRVEATDAAGNSASAEVEFIVDTVLPVGTIVINEGAPYTTSSAVTLSLSATDASGVTRMQFSNDGSSWTNPEAYATGKGWTLAGEGSKTVYVRYQDAAGLWSSASTGSILFDATAPTVVSKDPVDYKTGVPLSQIISILFSEDVQAGANYSGIVLKKGNTTVATTKAVSGNRLTITPNGALSRNAKYTVSIPASALNDMAGNALKTRTILSFTTTK